MNRTCRRGGHVLMGGLVSMWTPDEVLQELERIRRELAKRRRPLLPSRRRTYLRGAEHALLSLLDHRCPDAATCPLAAPPFPPSDVRRKRTRRASTT